MKKILVCNPEHFEISYEINPWMSVSNQVDKKLAIKQWHGLVEKLNEAGAEVVEMPGQPNLPDMVFTANAGIAFKNNKVLLADFKCEERKPEKSFYGEWFQSNGYQLITDVLDGRYSWEGAGDSLFLNQDNKEENGNILFNGYGFRSDYNCYFGHSWRNYFNGHMIFLKLIDPYFYHLDTCFCPLKDNFALIWPRAFEEATFKSIQNCIDPKQSNQDFVPLTLLKVPEDEAKKFACNAVCIGNNVIIPSGCPKTKQLLASAAFNVLETDMSEYIKSGGACKCLTLRI